MQYHFGRRQIIGQTLLSFFFDYVGKSEHLDIILVQFPLFCTFLPRKKEHDPAELGRKKAAYRQGPPGHAREGTPEFRSETDKIMHVIRRAGGGRAVEGLRRLRAH